MLMCSGDTDKQRTAMDSVKKLLDKDLGIRKIYPAMQDYPLKEDPLTYYSEDCGENAWKYYSQLMPMRAGDGGRGALPRRASTRQYLRPGERLLRVGQHGHGGIGVSGRAAVYAGRAPRAGRARREAVPHGGDAARAGGAPVPWKHILHHHPDK